jgi:hypothetical protein
VGFQRRLLARSELLRAASPVPVVQAVRSLSIEALDSIVQSLALHAGKPGGLGPGHAFQGIGDRQEPQGGPAILLAGRPHAQISWRVVLTDREPGHADLHQQCPARQ